jgi:hypothetical protein
MSVKIGDNGGIRIAPEDVTYGTAGTVYVVQHPKSASLGYRKSLIPPATLGAVNPATRKYGVPFVDSDIVLAYDDSRAVIGDLLAAAGNLVTNDYTIGDGSAPDEKSLTIWVDYGGYAIRYTGCVISGLSFEFAPDAPIAVTVTFLGQGASEQAAVTLTPPNEAGIVYESDISTITVNGAAMCTLTGTIDVQFPVVGSDRHCLGSGSIKEPQTAGRAVVTASLNVELADDTGADSEAALALFLAGTTLGSIVVGDFALANCYMTGDFPPLGEGITQFPINVEAQELVITTTA